MPTYEGLRLKLLNYWRIGLADYRRKRLKSTDFTIISNNCWGGMIYESYNLPKQTPTVGMFFMAEEYIEFLSDLKGYINGELTFINSEESRWKDNPQISGLPCLVSDTVTREMDFGNISWASIEADPQIWSDKILEIRDKVNIDRKSYYEKNRKQILDYDISNNVKQLEKFTLI